MFFHIGSFRAIWSDNWPKYDSLTSLTDLELLDNEIQSDPESSKLGPNPVTDRIWIIRSGPRRRQNTRTWTRTCTLLDFDTFSNFKNRFFRNWKITGSGFPYNCSCRSSQTGAYLSLRKVKPHSTVQLFPEPLSRGFRQSSEAAGPNIYSLKGRSLPSRLSRFRRNF